MTSREEGGPKAILESAATGVPVVSTRVGMAPDVIEDGTTGYLVDVEDTATTVQHAARLLADEHLRSEIAAAARAAIDPYDWRHVGNRHYRDVYAPLLGHEQLPRRMAQSL